VEQLGRGIGGEVYLIREMVSGIERTAKFCFPQRNSRAKNALFHTNKLHALRHCPIVIQYHAQDTVCFDGEEVRCLISEFVEGELLAQFLKRQRGARLSPFVALHLLDVLACGLESIHNLNEYHGDLHTENIIVQRHGLGFDLKFLDLYNWGSPTAANPRHDVVEAVRVFYEALGAKKHYSAQPREVKTISCGMKRTLILGKFRSAEQLRHHLETIDWS
jgi:serine/threonine protein kinase